MLMDKTIIEVRLNLQSSEPPQMNHMLDSPTTLHDKWGQMLKTSLEE